VTPMPISRKTFVAITKKRMTHYWQDQWSRRRFAFYKEVGPSYTALRRIRCEEIALCRLRTGITLITHVYPRLSNLLPFCDFCGVLLDIRHLLIDCLLYSQYRCDILNYFALAGTRLYYFPPPGQPGYHQPPRGIPEEC
ncbi:unnamed protein product, partial [Meganyctiphanes norvegica]